MPTFRLVSFLSRLCENLPQRGHVLRSVVPRLHGGRLLRIRQWSSPKVASRLQCKEFSMLQ